MPPKGKSKALLEASSLEAPPSTVDAPSSSPAPAPAPAPSDPTSKGKGKVEDSSNMPRAEATTSGSGLSLEEKLRSLRTTGPDSSFLGDDSDEELEVEVRTEAFSRVRYTVILLLLVALALEVAFVITTVRTLMRRVWSSTISDGAVDSAKFQELLPAYGRQGPIILLSFTYKVLARVMADRMKKFQGRVISQEQYRFPPGRRLTDAVGLVADIIDTARNDNEDKFLLLVDFKKAFDSVSRGYLFRTMRPMGFPDRFVKWLEGLHEGTQTWLLVNGWMGEGVEVVSDVRQGCPLAPYLFFCAVEPLAHTVLKRTLGISKGSERLAYIRYADDTTLVLEGKQQIIRAEQKVGEIRTDFGAGDKPRQVGHLTAGEQSW
ncbi:unnamed protein product [Closterium sp. NIES-53]